MCDLSEVPSIFRLGIGEWEARDASRTGLEPVAQTATGRMCFIKYTGPLTGTRQMCESTTLESCLVLVTFTHLHREASRSRASCGALTRILRNGRRAR